MSDKKIILPGDAPDAPHDPKNDLPAERRLPTAANLRNDVRSAVRQVESLRVQCEERLALRGREVKHDFAFLDSFAATLAVGAHQGWRGEVHVIVGILPRNGSTFCCRRTMASLELARGIVAKVAHEALDPYIVVPLGWGPLESLMILSPAGRAEPQWATTISEPRRLRSMLGDMLRTFGGDDAAAIDPDAPGGMRM